MNRLIRFADGISQAINALVFGGDNSNESLSGHAYRVNNKRWIKIIDTLCFWEKQHCKLAFENDWKATENYIMDARSRMYVIARQRK